MCCEKLKGDNKMTKITTISQQCVELVSKWEGFYAKAYDDLAPKKTLTENTKILGTLTIGYGTTYYESGQKVKWYDTITKERALALFKTQLASYASTIYTYVKVDLNQNQFDALTSFQYNLGKHILKNSSLLAYINQKQWDKAAGEIKKYNKARVGGVLQELKGLTNRRNEEAALFLRPVQSAPTPASSHIGVLTLNTAMNLRSHPDLNASILKVLPKGSAWKVAAIRDGRWYQLGNGWVSNPNEKYGSYKKK